MLGFEVVCASLLFAQLATLKGRLQKQMLGYDDVVTFCQVRGVSITEVFGLVTFALGFILFDMFVSLAEDDSLEALSYVFASVIGSSGLAGQSLPSDCMCCRADLMMSRQCAE